MGVFVVLVEFLVATLSLTLACVLAQDSVQDCWSQAFAVASARRWWFPWSLNLCGGIGPIGFKRLPKLGSCRAVACG